MGMKLILTKPKGMKIPKGISCPSFIDADKFERTPYDPRTMGVSISAINKWLTCRESARLHYIVGLRPNYTKNVFWIGNLNHDCLQEIYLEMRDEPDAPLDGLIDIVADFCGDKEEEFHEHPIAGVKFEDFQNQLGVTSVLNTKYIQHYYKEDCAYEFTHVEDEFLITLPSGIPFKGYYDGGVMRKKRQWLLETKFKARWSDSYLSSLEIDLQVGGYLAAMSVDNLDPAGCIFNLVRKPQLKRKVKESLKDFLTRISEDIDSRPEFYFQRLDLRFTRKEIAYSLRRLDCLAVSYVEWCETIGVKERDPLYNHGACEHKWGPCSYVPFCTKGDTSPYKRACDK